MSIVRRRKWPNGNPKSEKYLLFGHIYRKHGPAKTKWYENGQKQIEIYTKFDTVEDEKQIKSIAWYQSGQLKLIKYFTINMIGLKESYYENGDPKTKIIKEGEHFITRKWFNNRQIRLETWRDPHGNFFRHDGPARRDWSRDGQLIRESYYDNTQAGAHIHREWNQNGQILEETIKDKNTRSIIRKKLWTQNGQLVLDATGRTEKEWYPNGTPKKDSEIIDGTRIVSEYHEDGGLKNRKYTIDGSFRIHNCFGPAYICFLPNGTTEKEYWLVDQRYTKDTYKMAVKPPAVRILFQTILPPPIADEIWHYFRVAI